jgi:hypothetical protein
MVRAAMVLLAVLGIASAQDDKEEGFVSLFDKERLPDWVQCGPGSFKVENGVATGVGGMGLWYYKKKMYADFEWRGEWLQEATGKSDSGIFIRFPDPANDPWIAVKQGHEMEIGHPVPSAKSTGSFYTFQGPTELPLKPLGEWNQYAIICTGKRYQVRLNGKLINDYTDTADRPLKGYVGIQNFPWPGAVRHRNVRIKELP